MNFWDKTRSLHTDLVIQTTAVWIWNSDYNVRIDRLQVMSRPSDCSTCSCTRNECMDSSTCLFPDFWARPFEVCIEVGFVLLARVQRCCIDNFLETCLKLIRKVASRLRQEVFVVLRAVMVEINICGSGHHNWVGRGMRVRANWRIRLLCECACSLASEILWRCHPREHCIALFGLTTYW